jgi:glycosyltransferase involved in cell wall biosynthesis
VAPRPAPEPPSAGHLAIAAAGSDVMHFTNQSGFRTSIPSIYQPWDLQHVHLPDFFTPGQRAGRDRNYRAWSEQASRIVVATTWVKDDLAAQFGIDPERIVVVNPPPATVAYAPLGPGAESAIAQRLGLPEAFLFYPAQTWAHKNHDRLFEALAMLKGRGLEIGLISSGTLTDRYDGLAALAGTLGIVGQVRFLGYVSPADVQVLYQRARGMVFPSLYEGWGLPILEAFAAGLPVATSNATSLPALVGDAAIVFDPIDAAAIADAVERLWTDEPARQGLIERGRDRVAQFDWDTTARRLRAVYRDIAGRPLDAADRAVLATRPLV